MYYLDKISSRNKHKISNTFIETPGGVLGISTDGDDRMEPKVKTQKNP